jgi:hypothetical protein
LSKIRNDYAFHHPYDADIEAAADLAGADPASDTFWTWYFSKSKFQLVLLCE